MYCTSCGIARADGATACENCGTPVKRYPAPPNVENYLVPAILSALCCCLPVGVIAIVYAAQVNSKLAVGDVPGAMAASRNAKMWVWIAAGAGIAVGVAYAVFIAVTVAK